MVTSNYRKEENVSTADVRRPTAGDGRGGWVGEVELNRTSSGKLEPCPPERALMIDADIRKAKSRIKWSWTTKEGGGMYASSSSERLLGGSPAPARPNPNVLDSSDPTLTPLARWNASESSAQCFGRMFRCAKTSDDRIRGCERVRTQPNRGLGERNPTEPKRSTRGSRQTDGHASSSPAAQKSSPGGRD